MFCKSAIADCKSELMECFGPFAVKAIAFIAGATIFVPLVAAFAAPFIG